MRKGLWLCLGGFWAVFAVQGAGAAPCRPELDGSAPGPAASKPAAAERGHVREIVDGDTLVLDSGLEVRLTGIQAPKLPLGRANMRPWPLAPEAKAALEDMAGGRDLELYALGRDTDRYGRRLAQLRVAGPGGLWLQGEMVRRGFARVYTFADNRACAEALYVREREARAARRGIWRLAFYDIRRAEDDLGRDLGTFEIVEGTVRRVFQGKADAYLDFGADYKTDFSLHLDAEDLRLFGVEGYDLPALQGQTVRVRGWITKRNGAMIRLSHPEQIERVKARAEPD